MYYCIAAMGIEEGPVIFQMTATTLEIFTVYIHIVVGGRTFRQECNYFEGFGEMW
jgi:hypothetical protein